MTGTGTDEKWLRVNGYWLAGKCPAAGEITNRSVEAVQTNAADQTAISNRVADWLSGWGAYWFVTILLSCVVGGEIMSLGLFIALIKWFGQGREQDHQNRTDKLYHQMKKGRSFPIADAARKDTVANGNYNYNFENASYKDTWEEE